MNGSYARRRSIDIWPGFVDALAALLMVLIFVLMIFTVGQFFLTDTLTSKERTLGQLNSQVAELAELLSLEEATTSQLESAIENLRASLVATTSERDTLSATNAEQAQQLAGLATDIEMLTELRAQLESEVAALAGSLETTERNLTAQTEMSDRAQAQVTLLNRQVKQLRDQLTAVSSALELAESSIEEKDAEIADLGSRLNTALASKVQELAKYRSDFFGRLKESLGDNPDLRVEGDRFVFQSELLFASGSADLGDEGRAQLRRLANTLQELEADIPDDIDWVLRIDGHTDVRPITTPQFPSNWELSTARALAIVKYLTERGVSPTRLAATGFGEFHPLDARENELAFARNRRIELKLTSR